MRGGKGWMLGAVFAIAVAAPQAALAKGPTVEPVKLRDSCDKATFDATFGPGICQRAGGSVSAQTFLAKLNPKDFGHNAWWINASGGRLGTTKIKVGDTLQVTNEGGEAHTFTAVEKYSTAKSFTGGCVAGLSTPLGLAPFPGQCATALPATIVQPGATVNVTGLSAGIYHFQCLIHPWMRQTVEVDK
jgi:plastocyanin